MVRGFMNAPFDSKHVYLVGGPGGVGKTTLAAALGIRLAVSGSATVVLTVDPARRLAQALGFKEGFSTDLQSVAIPNFPSGRLYASMLDTSRYFDKIVERFAVRQGQKEKIFSNPLYRSMVDSLGGTHEYAAMERLLEFAYDTRFQRVVVDTPPSQNAMDLLSAPQRLANFMDNSVLKWFQGSKPVLQLFRHGTKLAMKFLHNFLGSEFMDSLSAFFDDMEGMQAGFKARNLEVLDLIRSHRTGFILVTYPSEARYLESTAFVQSLKENGIELAALILNRIEPPCPPTLEESVAKTVPMTEPINQILHYYHRCYEEQREWVSRFQTHFSTTPTFLISKQNKPPQDVESLLHVGNFLVTG